ncbi:unannotated protein [freshwater metagenome]|uniref:Unannotated protein n=1 Tax=freshwater metagenome TaxID=449393 RepID=A0A6J7E1L2_9ZZZZ
MPITDPTNATLWEVVIQDLVPLVQQDNCRNEDENLSPSLQLGRYGGHGEARLTGTGYRIDNPSAEVLIPSGECFFLPLV